MSWLWAFYKWQQSFWGAIQTTPHPPVTMFFLSMCLWTFIPISVSICPCLCASPHVFVSLWYIFSARPKHSAPPPPVHPCLCVSDGAGKRWGGSCSSYLQTPLSHTCFYWRGQKLLAMSLNFSRVALKWLQTKDNEAAMLVPHVVN